MHGLNAVQLSIALKTNIVTNKCTSCIFARDKLETISSNPPKITIVNTDPIYKEGKHWLLIYFNDNRTVEFFDSLGYDLDYYHNSIKKFIQKFSNKHVNILRCRL